MEKAIPDTLYHLFMQVMQLHYRRARVLLEDVGVYPGQPPMLIVLSHKDGQSQKELSEALGVKPSTITVMLQRMEKGELVERRPDPEDQRISRVYLTDRGRKVAAKVNQVMSALGEECFGNLPEQDQSNLSLLLSQVRDNLEAGLNEVEMRL